MARFIRYFLVTNFYSRSSPNEHSHNRTTLLTATFTKPYFSQLHYKLCTFCIVISGQLQLWIPFSPVPRVSAKESFHCISVVQFRKSYMARFIRYFLVTNFYSRSSPNEHSHNRTTLLTATFTKPYFSQLHYKLCTFCIVISGQLQLWIPFSPVPRVSAKESFHCISVAKIWCYHRMKPL